MKMKEKENLIFDYKIKRDKRDFILTYKKEEELPGRSGESFIQFNAYHLWLENYSNKKNVNTKIKGFVKTNHILSTTVFPFKRLDQEYIPITIEREHKHVSKHAGDVIKLNLSVTSSLMSKHVNASYKKSVNDDLKNYGVCLHFFHANGLQLNFYLGARFDEILNALLENSLDFVELDIFFPNLYSLKERKHIFEYHYRFFDGDFDKGLIRRILVGRNASNKDTTKNINTSNVWLENYERIHPVDRKIENIYFTNDIFRIIRSIYDWLFVFEKNDQKAIRHLLTFIVVLLIIIAFKLYE